MRVPSNVEQTARNPNDRPWLLSKRTRQPHITELTPLYAEAARLARRGAAYVLVGFHPFFIMATGMPTHFQGIDGEPVAIETHVHLLSDHAQAALAAGWQLAEFREQVIDNRWVEMKPSWAAYRDVPISFAWVWRRHEI